MNNSNSVHPSTELSVARGCTLILLGILLLGTLIPLSSAAVQTLGTFKPGEEINLIQVANASACTITSVAYPNRSYFLKNVAMTKDDTEFNYTVRGLWPTGQYIVNGQCDTVVWAYDFYVTPSGVSQDSILENPIQIILFLLGVVLLLIGIFIRNPFIGFISAVMFLLNGIYVMIYGLNNVTDLYTQGTGFVLIGVALMIMMFSAFEFIWGGDDE